MSISSEGRVAQLRALQMGGSVRRYHTHPVIEPQNLGHHSHSVAMFLWMITGGTNAYHLMAALTHDLGEQVTGDIPSPAKRALGIRDQVNAVEKDFLMRVGFSFEELSEEEQRQLKLADAFDGLLYCITERRKGNKFIEQVFNTFYRYVRLLIDSNAPHDEEIFSALWQLWQEANA